MSLFEQFFSDINKNFMYDMVCKIFLKDNNIDIKNDKSNFTLMDSKMKSLFDNNNYEDISDINKELLDSTLNDLKKKYNQIENGDDLKDSLEKLMKERERNIIEPEKPKINNTFGGSTPIKELLNKKEDNVYENNQEEKHNQTLVEDNVVYAPVIKINSSKRVNIKSSRYNYIFDLKNIGVNSQDIKEISKVIIPIEDNYIFSLPIMTLNIKELDISLVLQQEEMITNKSNSIAIYKPIEKVNIETVNVDRLTIDIRDITGEKYKHTDILKINIIEIKENIIIFTCSNFSKNNYKINDMIKVLNTNTFDIKLMEVLSNPLKVNAIKKNMIFCSTEVEHENKVYNNIDMRIMNMSNQNLIIFNQSS